VSACSFPRLCTCVRVCVRLCACVQVVCECMDTIIQDMAMKIHEHEYIDVCTRTYIHAHHIHMIEMTKT